MNDRERKHTLTQHTMAMECFGKRLVHESEPRFPRPQSDDALKPGRIPQGRKRGGKRGEKKHTRHFLSHTHTRATAHRV